MSSFFSLAYSVLPHRKNPDTGKWEVLKNPEKLTELAFLRLSADPEPVVEKSYFMSAHDEEFMDEEGEWDETAFREYLEDLVKNYVELYDSSYVALIAFDVPRLFTGGISYGDSTWEESVLIDMAELGFFREPVGDTELATSPEDWFTVN